jgi:hypothetical protein
LGKSKLGDPARPLARQNRAKSLDRHVSGEDAAFIFVYSSAALRLQALALRQPHQDRQHSAHPLLLYAKALLKRAEALLKRAEALLKGSEADFQIPDVELQIVYPIGQRGDPRAE